mgnify:CR=1 FL=1
MHVLLFLIATGGCAAIDERVATYGELSAAIELDSTPFYPQERFQCGPAALTTILEASGTDASIDAVTSLVFIPAREGSLQAEILGATRANERIPYQIDGSLSALIAELEAGRPILVLQNLGVNWRPAWHYAVVIGVDPEADNVVLRSGTEPRRITPTRTFLRTWKRADFWGIVALRPGTLPAIPDRERFLSSLANFERVGHADVAYSSWQAAVDAWPHDTGALFGLASAAFTRGRYAEAETHYRGLLEMRPDNHAARNNLAYALAWQGRPNEALEEIEQILLAVDSDDPFRSDYEDSWSEIAAMLPPEKNIW